MSKNKQTLVLLLLNMGFTVRTSSEAITVVATRQGLDLVSLELALTTCKVKQDVSKEPVDSNLAIFIK